MGERRMAEIQRSAIALQKTEASIEAALKSEDSAAAAVAAADLHAAPAVAAAELQTRLAALRGELGSGSSLPSAVHATQGQAAREVANGAPAAPTQSALARQTAGSSGSGDLHQLQRQLEALRNELKEWGRSERWTNAK